MSYWKKALSSFKEKLNAFCRNQYESSLDILNIVFITSLIIIGWGKIIIEPSNGTSIILGGSTKSLIFLVFLIYIPVRLIRNDIKGFSFIKDPLTIFGLTALISILCSEQKDISLITQTYLPAILAYYMLSYLLYHRKEKLLAYLKVLVIFSVLIILRGFADVSSNFFTNPTIMTTSSEHHTIVAMIILCALPFAVSLMLIEKHNLYLAAICIMLMGLILCNSRIGWLSLIIVAFYLLYAIRIARTRLFLFISITAGSILFLIFFKHLHYRFMTLFNLLGDRDFIARLAIWHHSLIFIKNHPFLGIGFSVRSFMAEGLKYSCSFNYNHPHNIILAILVYTGLIGFSIFIWMVYKIFKSLSFCKTSENLSSKLIISAFKASFLSLFIMNMADSLLTSTRASLIVSIIIACLYAFERHCKEN